MNRRLPFALGVMLLPFAGSHAAGQAWSLPYPVDIERQHGSTLVIEHTPVAPLVRAGRIGRAKVVVRHRVRRTKRIAVEEEREFVRNPALAGGCHDGGFVQRVARDTPAILHRDVCEGIAPISWTLDWMTIRPRGHGEAEAR